MGKHHDDDRVYEDVALDDMEYVEEEEMWYYQCPCGDMFELSKVRGSLLTSLPFVFSQSRRLLAPRHTL